MGGLGMSSLKENSWKPPQNQTDRQLDIKLLCIIDKFRNKLHLFWAKPFLKPLDWYKTEVGKFFNVFSYEIRLSFERITDRLTDT